MATVLTTTADPTGAAAGVGTSVVTARGRGALGVLTAYAVLLFLLPSRLVVPPLGSTGAPVTMFGLVLIGWWAATRLWRAGRTGPVAVPVHLAVGLLLGAVTASYAWSALHPLPDLQREAADRALLGLVALAGPALVAADLLPDRSAVEALVRRAVALGGVVAAVACVQFATGFDLAESIEIPGLGVNGALTAITERSGFRRVTATTDHPIELGMVMVALLPFALHVVSRARRRRLLWTLVAALIAATVPLTLSRSAIIGSAVALAVLLWGWDGRRRAALIVALPPIIVGMRLAVPGLVGSIGSLFRNASNDPSVLNRTDAYALVGAFIDRSPVLGRGFGTFIPSEFFFLDNQYLGSLVETGLVGTIALVAFFVLPIVTARRVRRRAVDPSTRDLALAAMASVAAVAIGFLLFDGLAFPTIDGLLFLIVGAIGALWRFELIDAAAASPP